MASPVSVDGRCIVRGQIDEFFCVLAAFREELGLFGFEAEKCRKDVGLGEVHVPWASLNAFLTTTFAK
jgi:hypothetical protein